MWIEPKDSFVVQVKAVEICTSDKYKTGCTLRFPRLEKFRADKAWHECMRTGELTKLREKNEGFLASGKHYSLDNGSAAGGEDEPVKKRKKTVTKRFAVDSNFKGIDASLVDRVDTVFEGKEFCIVVDEDYTKKSLLERQIAELGGEIAQNPGKDTFCVLTSKITHRIQGYIRRNAHNIVKLEWIQRCIADRRLYTWRPSDMYHSTAETQRQFDKLYDEYGDSYMEDATENSLRSIFAAMSSSEYASLDANDPKTVRELWQQMAEIENEYFPDESARFGLFRLCEIYVAPNVTGSGLIKLRIRWRGGRVTEHASDQTTHCVLDRA